MDLVNAMRGEYSFSEKLLWGNLAVKGAIYLTTVATFIWASGTISAVLLVFACLGQACLFVLRILERTHLATAERLRRLAVLQDGLGVDPAPAELAVLAEKVWNRTTPSLGEPYYSSQSPKGPSRLVDIVSECAFYSSSIAGSAWRLFLVGSVGASTLLLTVFVLLVLSGVGKNHIDLIAKAFLLAVTFWMTEDVIASALEYRSVALACERVLLECSRLLHQRDLSVDQAYIVLHEYDAAVIGAPPLPGIVYRNRRKRLAQIWTEANS